MQYSYTAVIERNATLEGKYTTEPYETGWAREARWFIKILDNPADDIALSVYDQISADGLDWCDLDGEKHNIQSAGVTSWPVNNFGPWMRLRISAQRPIRVMIYLTLKG